MSLNNKIIPFNEISNIDQQELERSIAQLMDILSKNQIKSVAITQDSPYNKDMKNTITRKKLNAKFTEQSAKMDSIKEDMNGLKCAISNLEGKIDGSRNTLITAISIATLVITVIGIFVQYAIK